MDRWFKNRIQRHSINTTKTVLIVFSCLFLSACFFNEEPEASWSTSVEGVYSADFSHDGLYAAVGSFQHGGSLWRTDDGERLYNWNHDAEKLTAITALSFSPEGDYVVTADERTLVLWDVYEGNALRYFNTPGEIRFIKLTPGGEKALLSLTNGEAILFDIQRGGVIHEMAHSAEIIDQALSADGRYALFSLSNRNTVFWDLHSGTVVREINTDSRVHTIALSADGSLAFMAIQHREAAIWDMRSGEQLSKLKYNNPFFPSFSSFLTARFYGNGQQLLTGNTTGAMELWDTTDGRRIERWVTPKTHSISVVSATASAVVAVAKHDSLQQVVALTSNGHTHRYGLNIN
jgi:WD40 repeat protein